MHGDYRFEDAPTLFGAPREELTRLGAPKVFATSSHDVIDEYFGHHQNIDRRVEGRWTYRSGSVSRPTTALGEVAGGEALLRGAGLPGHRRGLSGGSTAREGRAAPNDSADSPDEEGTGSQ